MSKFSLLNLVRLGTNLPNCVRISILIHHNLIHTGPRGFLLPRLCQTTLLFTSPLGGSVMFNCTYISYFRTFRTYSPVTHLGCAHLWVAFKPIIFVVICLLSPIWKSYIFILTKSEVVKNLSSSCQTFVRQ